MKISKLIVSLSAGGAFIGCAVSAGEQTVLEVLNNKEHYLGQEFTVAGVLSVTAQEIAICESGLPEVCLNLEVPRKMFYALKAKSGTRVCLRGRYEHHEFRDVDGEVTFYPSRFVVLDLVR